MRTISTFGVVRYWSNHTAGMCELHTTAGGTILGSPDTPASRMVVYAITILMMSSAKTQTHATKLRKKRSKLDVCPIRKQHRQPLFLRMPLPVHWQHANDVTRDLLLVSSGVVTLTLPA